MSEKTKKSLFENPLLSTKVKSSKVKLFPEAILGYFGGPTFALLANSILSSYLNLYFTNVLDLGGWASTFLSLLPIISVIFVVLGNILVGRLMNHSKTRAGKARPLLLLSVPFSILALFLIFILSPLPAGAGGAGNNTLVLILLAVGYNLWFAVAYPIYFTPHSSIVTLSTRDGKARSLLATISNATALAAMGLTSMFLPFFLGLLFVNTAPKGAPAVYDTAASYGHWKIFVIALMIITLVGVVLEYFFTRERITEESFTLKRNDEKVKKVSLKKQAAVCFKDKFWVIMIIFFLLYQFGGMMKNVSQIYYCQAWFAIDGIYSVENGGTFSGTIAIIGAVPTALGMLVVWPLSNKIGKGKAIMLGACLAVIGGAVGFIAPDNFACVATSFVIKAFGSTPAMYISLALLADIMDHQEAVHGIRTDGFTMTIYGAIMAGMTGICTGILNAVITGNGYTSTNVSSPQIQNALKWVFIGGETICYAVIALMFLFMKVEKFSKLDHLAIIKDQQMVCESKGIEWIEPKERARREEAENARLVEEARLKELHATCEKKNLDFDTEEAKYQAMKKENDKKAEAKKAAMEAKKAEKAKAEEVDPKLTTTNIRRDENQRIIVDTNEPIDVNNLDAYRERNIDKYWESHYYNEESPKVKNVAKEEEVDPFVLDEFEETRTKHQEARLNNLLN